MPNTAGRFHLYSDTSKFATGSALYQIQNVNPKLIAYASKRIPEAAKNYSITELNLWISYKYSQFFPLVEKIRF